MTSRGRVIGILLKEVLPTAVAGVVVFQFIRAVCLERYLVPSASMEPTLHGDPATGDLVLVNKLAYWWGNEPERFDLVVLENPDTAGSHLVKRVVAFGDEQLVIRDGDLFVGDGSAPVQRLQKDPVGHRSMFQPWFTWGVGAAWGAQQDDWIRGSGEAFESTVEGLRLRPLADASALFDAQARRERAERIPPVFHVPGALATARQVDASFECVDGRRRGKATQPVRDAMLAVDLVPDAGVEALLMEFEYSQRPYCFRWAADGAVELFEWQRELARFEAPPLRAGQAVTVRYGFLDGRLFLVVDGQVVGLHGVDRLARPAGEILSRLAPRNLLQLACVGGGVVVTALRVEHDVHYVASPVPRRDKVDEWFVETDELFLLGDNTTDSRDSRDRHFRRADLLGSPVMILGPRPRTRWLR